MVASLAALLLLPPIPQDQSYHQFADQRTLFGIPNFWNVVSNLPFIAVGAVGLAAVSSRSGNPGDLSRDIPDRLRLVLLSLGSERRYVVLGPAADDALLHGNPCRCRRGAREREGGSRSALAAACNRHVQSVAMALERRFAALRLGAIFSLPGIAAAVPAVPAEIYRIVSTGSLPRRSMRSPSCSSTLNKRFIRSVHPQRAYAQAPLRGCCLFRDTEIFPDAPADSLIALMA